RRRVTIRHGGRAIARSALRTVRGRRFFLTAALRRPLPASGVVDVLVTGWDRDHPEEGGRRRRFRFAYKVTR
ncbi:MAG: hypothetical protein M3389_15685, partial [Actinomycetota bacterium]|nr:hypothetical protein [Actinomycetota bacterium]